MNQWLMTVESPKVIALLQEALAWVEGGLDGNTLLNLQDRAKVIIATNSC